MQHPGCAQHRDQRRRYSDGFRGFILELRERHQTVPVDAFAAAVQVPLGTLKDWLRGGQKDTDPAAPKSTAASTAPATSAQVQTVIAQWRAWKGTFSAFCDHVRQNLRIPFGRTIVASILELHSERAPSRRSLDDLLRLSSDPIDAIKSITDRALQADRHIDRIFWLAATADIIRRQHRSRHVALLRFASRRIHAAFALNYRDRQKAVRFICSRAIPLA